MKHTEANAMELLGRAEILLQMHVNLQEQLKVWQEDYQSFKKSKEEG